MVDLQEGYGQYRAVHDDEDGSASERQDSPAGRSRHFLFWSYGWTVAHHLARS